MPIRQQNVHRRPVEPQRRRARRPGPDRPRQPDLRRQRLQLRRPAPAAAQGRLQGACSRRSPAARRSTPSLADAVALAMKEWALEKGATHYTHWFQPLTGLDRREARLLLRPDGRRHGAGRVLRQGADPGRARRVVVPHRRHPRHLRGARLHRLGPDQPRVHPREPQRRAALHPDRVRLLDRRGARPQDPAAALDGRALASRRSAR